MPCVVPAPALLSQPVLDNPPSLSAKELHEILLTANAGGNVARRRFIDALRSLHESRLYLQLGFPDTAAYADATFQYQRSQVYDFLRVSKALLNLPRLAADFEHGEISWTLLAALTRVADEESEGEWLEYLQGRSVRAVLAELKDAEKKRRTRPRRDGYGLPGLPVKLSFEFAPQDHAVVERGLEKVANEMAASLDGARPSPVEALRYLMLRVLATEPEASVTAGRAEREGSLFTVVFHRCPDCRRAAVESNAGRVEVPAEAMDRIELCAEHFIIDEIIDDAAPAAIETPDASSEVSQATPQHRVLPGERDRPNTAAVRHLLLHREGGRCANPFCRRETGPEGHGHHITLRSEGGRTELANEVWLCTRCHALVHAGCLKLSGDALRGLVWEPVAADLTRSVREVLRRISEVTRACVVEVTRESRHLDSPGPPPPEAEEDVIAALVELGWSREQASRRFERAQKRILKRGGDSDAIAVEVLLGEALRG